MTTDLRHHLNLILAECRLIVEMAPTLMLESRSFSPAAAKALIATIPALLTAIEKAERVSRIRWGWDGDCGADDIAEEIIETAESALQSICDQFAYLLEAQSHAAQPQTER